MMFPIVDLFPKPNKLASKLDVVIAPKEKLPARVAFIPLLPISYTPSNSRKAATGGAAFILHLSSNHKPFHH